MLKKLAIILLSFVLLGFTNVKAVKSVNKNTLVSKLMMKAGINRQIENLPLSIIKSVRENDSSDTSDQQKELERLFLKSFDTEKITSDISRYLEANLDQEHMNSAIKWFESDLGRKIVAIEASSDTPEKRQHDDNFSALLDNSQPLTERAELVQRFTAATDDSQIIIDMETAILLSVMRAVDHALPEQKRSGPDRINQEMDSFREKTAKSAKNKALDHNFSLYRSLSDTEFKKYVEYVESPSGKRVYKEINLAVRQAIVNAALPLEINLGSFYQSVVRQYVGDVLVQLKDGRTWTWKNLTIKEDRYCTMLQMGEFCLDKNEVASVGSEQQQSQTRNWLFGEWKLAYDPDKGPGDYIDFFPNNYFIVKAPGKRPFEGEYSFETEGLHLTSEENGKNVSLVMKISADKSRLTNGSGAYYKKVSY